MLLKYFYDTRLAHASYMVGCQKTGEAIIIDPSREVEHYLAAAAKEGMQIIGAADTHIHADYLSGARELAERVGAKLFVSDEGPADWKFEYAQEYEHQLLKDGDTFAVGNVEFEVMFTPGHTPESVSYILTDKGAGADRPMGVFTGDCVFVGSSGRPDLLEEAAGVQGTAEPGARQLYQSLQRFKNLPDYLQVWPAHGAGSACGKGLGAVPSSTVGYEKMFNPALQFEDEQAFVDYILAEQPEAPKYFAVMKLMNRMGAPVLGEPVLPKKLETKKLMTTVKMEMVIDTAVARKFAEAHVAGTINIEPKYIAMWGGSLIDYSRPVYVIASRHDLAEVMRIMRKVGMDNVAGYFDADEVAEAGFKTETIEQRTPEQLKAECESGGIEMVDVRGMVERNEVRIPGSSHSFLGQLPRETVQLRDDKTYAFVCRTGGRSVIAASIARKAGVRNVLNLDGGVVRWEKDGLEVDKGSGQSVEA
ncbi:MAG: MBL fold metallo-hydrolase [Planctomycetota bacterium]